MTDLVAPKRFTTPLRAAIGTVLMGVLFKLQHWPGAAALMQTGVLGIVVLYPLRYAAKRPKAFLDHVKLGLALTWPTSWLMQVQHWPYAQPLGLAAAAFGLVWITQAGVAEFWNDKERRSPGWSSIVLFTLGLVLVIAGTLFRIQHWPYATVLLLAGLACCGLWAVVEFLLPGRRN
ncbi:MAG: hypothetical protein JNL05_08950 [Flavobacteriales bacterium]|nr:hypothetical protein [Flavobacteriales bacterium]